MSPCTVPLLHHAKGHGEIGSRRRHENSGRFVGSKPREEEADSPFSVVADTCKYYGLIVSYQRFCGSHTALIGCTLDDAEWPYG
jgi:hypothetical protein